MWVLYRESSRQRRFWSWLNLADGPSEILGLFTTPDAAWKRVVQLEPDVANRCWQRPAIARSDDDYVIVPDQGEYSYSLESHLVIA